MSKDDETEFDPDAEREQEREQGKFFKNMNKMMEKQMEESERAAKEREARGRVVARAVPHGSPFDGMGEYLQAQPVYAIATPSVQLKKITNGWVVSYVTAQGFAETFATVEQVGDVVKQACIETEKQYEQAKKTLEELNKRPMPNGGLDA